MQGKSHPSMEDRCDERRYQFAQATGAHLEDFEALLLKTYKSLAFPIEQVQADSRASRYVSLCKGHVASICALQPADPDGPLAELVRQELGGEDGTRFLELKNVVVARAFRGTIALGHMLYQCAQLAHRTGYRALVGLTRYQTLRYFVEYGVTPLNHEPLHLLGRRDLHDFAIYFDTQDARSVCYMHERSRRYFQQLRVMNAIRGRVRREEAKSRPASLPA